MPPGKAPKTASLLIFALCLWALPVTFSAAQQTTAQDLLAEYGLPVHDLGYIVFDPESGAWLESHNPTAGFIPASTAKIPMAVAALEILGPQHRFRTELHATGEVRGITLHGDLYLKGGGDPFLATEDLLALLKGLGQRRFSSVIGNYYYDVSGFPELPAINAAQPPEATYNPGLSALNLNFNGVALNWKAPQDGPVTARAISRSDAMAVETPAIAVLPEFAALEAGEFYRHRQTEAGELWQLSQVLPREGAERLPVKDPARNTAAALRSLAVAESVFLPAAQAGRMPPSAVRIAGHESLPLAEMLRGVLKFSNNLAAEMIGLTAAKTAVGRPPDEAPTLEGSAALLGAWFAARLPETDWRGYDLKNHSGLSSDSRITPAQMAAILGYAYARRGTPGDLLAVLPEARASAKVNGEVEGEIEILAKSGTINYGRALAGYLTAASGRQLGFAVFVSDVPRRRAYDERLAARQTDDAAARGWLGRARGLETELLKRWAAKY
ncbi:MAG: D-alanyl-D-alanine carboxypeptidase/D-alanyl-D-alanine-endopeptidase [Rhodovibrionaceae bacterium]